MHGMCHIQSVVPWRSSSSSSMPRIWGQSKDSEDWKHIPGIPRVKNGAKIDSWIAHMKPHFFFAHGQTGGELQWTCLVAGVDQEETQEKVSRPKGMHLAQRRTSEIWWTQWTPDPKTMTSIGPTSTSASFEWAQWIQKRPSTFQFLLPSLDWTRLDCNIKEAWNLLQELSGNLSEIPTIKLNDLDRSEATVAPALRPPQRRPCGTRWRLKLKTTPLLFGLFKDRKKTI